MNKFLLGHLTKRLLNDKIILGGSQEISGVSGGELKRLFLMFAYLSRKNTVFLDEPLSGLDSQHKLAVVDVINSLFSHVNLFIITHELSEKIISDQLIEIKEKY